MSGPRRGFPLRPAGDGQAGEAVVFHALELGPRAPADVPHLRLLSTRQPRCRVDGHNGIGEASRARTGLPPARGPAGVAVRRRKVIPSSDTPAAAAARASIVSQSCRSAASFSGNATVSLPVDAACAARSTAFSAFAIWLTAERTAGAVVEDRLSPESRPTVPNAAVTAARARGFGLAGFAFAGSRNERRSMAVVSANEPGFKDKKGAKCEIPRGKMASRFAASHTQRQKAQITPVSSLRHTASASAVTGEEREISA